MLKTNCEFCGKEIWRKPSYLKKFKHFYCDRNCRFNHIRSQQPRVSCSACGKEIILKRGRRRNSRTGLYFCNNECKNPYIAKHKRWFQNPDCHRARRPIVLEAANYACQNCGYNQDLKMLDVHHNDGVHTNNEWFNLRSLCVWCHVGHHRQSMVLKKNNDLSPQIKKIINEQKIENKIQEELKNKQKLLQKNKCLNCGTEIGNRTKTKTCTDCYNVEKRKPQGLPWG